MAKKKLQWDAGHSETDSGAVGFEVERKLIVKVVNYAYDYIEDNYECEQRKTVASDSLNRRCTKANEWGADLFVSVHFNAGGGDGYEALVYSAKGAALGRCFEKQVKAIGQNSRGVKYRPDLAVLRLTDMPAVLNEMAFVDTKKDIQDWNDNAELKAMGIALAEAAADWLNLPKKKSEPQKKPETQKKPSSDSFKVKIIVNALNFRAGAGIDHKINGQVHKNEVYTITEVKNGWGKLKSGAGWINISTKYVKRV